MLISDNVAIKCVSAIENRGHVYKTTGRGMPPCRYIGEMVVHFDEHGTRFLSKNITFFAYLN